MRFHFPVIIIDEDFRSENTSGLGIRALADAIEKEGLEVLGVTSYGDLTSFAQQQSRASAFILSIDDEELALEPEETLAELRAFVSEIRNRNAEIPIFLHGETRTSRHIPNDVLRELHGFIHMFEDTPEFIARNVARGQGLPRFAAAALLPGADALRGRRLVFGTARAIRAASPS
jgi:arginine decarboxylase